MAASILIKIKAIVIRSAKYGEQDKMLSLLTENGALYSAAAKGARSAKSRLRLASQLFCASEFVLRDSKGIYYIESADVLAYFQPLSESLLKNAAACGIAEFGEAAAKGNEDEQLYRLVGHALSAISDADEKYSTAILTNAIMRLCSLLGIRPRLNGCAVCGKAYSQYYFDPDSGSLLCTTDNHTAFLNKVTADEARYLAALSALEPKQVCTSTLPHQQTQRSLFMLAANYLAHYFGKLPNSCEMLFKMI